MKCTHCGSENTELKGQQKLRDLSKPFIKGVTPMIYVELDVWECQEPGCLSAFVPKEQADKYLA